MLAAAAYMEFFSADEIHATLSTQFTRSMTHVATQKIMANFVVFYFSTGCFDFFGGALKAGPNKFIA